MYRVLIPAAAVCLMLSAMSAQAAAPQSEDDKTLYALGVILARDLGPLNLNAEEMKMVTAGLTDAALGEDSQVDLPTYGPKVQALAQARVAAAASSEQQLAAAFVETMAATEGAETTSSGLVYIVLEEGTGPSPSASDTVRVHYHGTLRDGTVFDSSVDRGESISFPLDGVIPCWTEGVQKMKVGGKSRLVCPAAIAYGDRGAGTKVKPGAALNFEVELLAIE
ncbi:MAG: FKBP-type peptidyl-prolyl cis-trans isomerase [Gammaproteobacteria bacterium]